MAISRSDNLGSSDLLNEVLKDPELAGVSRELIEERLRLATVTNLSDEDAARGYLEQFRTLPDDARLYQITTTGRIFVAGNNSVEELRKDNPAFAANIHQFINAGNLAHYLLGSPQTNADNPQNATFKLGMTDPQHAFTPHAHGARHFVTAMGHSGCILFDKGQQTTVPIKLLPGSMIDIPGGLPHAFYNRSKEPLVIVVANAGLGIEHEDYAVTREMALQRLRELSPDQSRSELEELATALERIEADFNAAQPNLDISVDERLARALYKLAEKLNMGGAHK